MKAAAFILVISTLALAYLVGVSFATSRVQDWLMDRRMSAVLIPTAFAVWMLVVPPLCLAVLIYG